MLPEKSCEEVEEMEGKRSNFFALAVPTIVLAIVY
jgi:hypothetical protein